MRLLSSSLSKTRRRIYGLLGVGAVVALGASAVGGLIVLLGHSQPDVTQPFWESGEYVALLGLFNLGVYAALFWQVGRLSRREGQRSSDTLSSALDPDDAEGIDGTAPDLSASVYPPNRAPVPSARPKVTRRVRGNAASLHLDSEAEGKG